MSQTVMPRAARGADVPMQGAVLCPPDKSLTHRAVMFGAMAAGTSRILRPLMGADCLSTMAAMRALGARIEITRSAAGDEVVIESPGWDRWQSPVAPLDFGNSGTTTRLLTGLFAATPGLFVTCFGDASLSRRPMGRVVTPLKAAGAVIHGREDGRLLPLAIIGTRLRPAAHRSDKASAQVKSALILAGLNIEGESSVTLPRGGRDHTERLLARLGATISVTVAGDLETIRVTGPFRPPPGVYEVPGDPSSAAFLCVYAALVAGSAVTVNRVLDNPTRTGFMRVLERMGAAMTWTPSADQGRMLEPVIDVTVRGGAPLRSVDIEAELAPSLIDEIPILAVAARFAAGTSRFRGLAELRVKESDRLQMTIDLMKAAGAEAWAEGDDLLVAGDPGSRPGARSFDPDADHRLAMAAGVLGRLADGAWTIADPECVAVSFPGFFQIINQLG